MAKRLGVSPKSVESRVSVQTEAKWKLWDAVPILPTENLKAWFPRAARELTRVAKAAGYDKEIRWSARRIRALWNGEARRIDHLEIKILGMREQLNTLQEGAAKRWETLNDFETRLAALRPDPGGRDPGGDRQGAAALGGRGAGEMAGGTGEDRTDATLARAAR